MKDLILVTGGDGIFSKVLKKYNKSLNLYFANKKECNILKINTVDKIVKKIKPKIILHCAALSRPMSVHETDIVKSIDLNIIGTSNVTKICKKNNIKLIYFSTGYVYEGKRGNYYEEDPVKPFNNYGLSKLGGECAVKMYKNSLILRLTMTEKPFRFKKAYSNLISNFIFHEEVVKMLPKVINQKGIINIGGKSQSVYSFAKTFNKNIKKITLKKRSKLPLRQDMNTSKLKTLLS
tara:strand:+ start:974 stop:1678 length:705 start_codon:yes stop_codon:yes gene_type:complete